jgi:hypothetical protein
MTRRAAIAASLLAVALVGVAVLSVVRSVAHIPVISDDAPRIYDESSLPDRLHVCGRSWHRSDLAPQSRVEIHTLQDTTPVLVTPRDFAGCPSGACAATAAGSCATVVYARVGDDAYASYALAGGP